MTDPNPTLVSTDDISQLNEQFQSASQKQQLQLIPELVSAGKPGLSVLKEFLLQQSPPALVVGKAYQALLRVNTPETQKFLENHFPNGVVPLKSERNVDYQLLGHLLIQQDFQAADRLTRQKLCELAGEAAVKRKWPYFTEVEQFPSTDLQTIDRLWWIYSEGKFGFSSQRQIWLSLGRDFAKLWHKIGWRKENEWMQYPDGFTWDLNAPRGHLPLSNQLRGVRVFASLMTHPVWSSVPLADTLPA